MSLNVANCPRCGKIFAMTIKNLCPDCAREDEEMYEKVYRYLRDNPNSTLQQVSAGTGVPEEHILNFLREDRIYAAEWSQLSYPCERCGAGIKRGRYCDTCAKEMHKTFQAAAQHLETEVRRTGGGYHYDVRRPRKD